MYLDANSLQLKYGAQEDTEHNLVGPFNYTSREQHLTFEEWEGFCAVEIESGKWAVFFDVHDDGLVHLPLDARIVEIELERRGPENFPVGFPRHGSYTNLNEEKLNGFQKGNTLAICEKLEQNYPPGTALSMMCTQLPTTERHIEEEVCSTSSHHTLLLISALWSSSYSPYLVR